METESKLEDLREWLEEREEGVRVLVGGDFNARTGKGGGIEREGEKTERSEEIQDRRKSKDKVVNAERKYLFSFLEEQDG